ncbi:Gfo/Idh/MocA family oxidoreductase [Nocardia sp. NPDC051463]|uniref:Gfo/Idh/MocA family protein n=1 Tax=Nocardia sp. NPDC051463 TaxID=3154845 RepID=UPI00344ECFAA
MNTQQKVTVGIIGGGLMGREVAATIARWPALVDHPVRPVLVGVCDTNPAALAAFDSVDTIITRVTDYRDLLADDNIDVVYIAVRHDLHAQIYRDAIRAGKDVLGEKPFGIDAAAAASIIDEITENPNVFVRCSSEMPFFPAAQAAISLITGGALGTLIEASNEFSHSSDFDTAKPINWKRQRRFCGDAGVMNDLGMHVLHVPLRLGWQPDTLYAVLQNLVAQRPGPDGDLVPCDTYENAHLLCRVVDRGDFPLTLGMRRIDPGQKNSWTLRAVGMNGGVAFSTRYPKTLRVMKLDGREQVWQEVEIGSQGPFATVTGGIFETGFSDAMLQMWASFLAERAGQLGDRFGCATPAEALRTHEIFAAALQSQQTHQAVAVANSAVKSGR